MKPTIAAIAVAFSLAATGCVGDRTRNMTRACQGLLEEGVPTSDARSFIRAAEEQLADLGKPANRLTAYMRELQDPHAMDHKAALEQCLWLLKYRQR